NTPVTLHGHASDVSADVVSYNWQVVASNGQVISAGNELNFTFTPNAAGTYTATFTATDDDGGANSASVIVTATPAPAPPSASITEGSSSVAEGSLVTLHGTFAHFSGSPSFTWYVSAANGQSIADGHAQTFSFTPNDNVAYTVTFTATNGAESAQT